MFINQVDGSGNFKVTNVNSDNVTATNATFTNLNTTTFSPTNFNAHTAVVSNNLTSTNSTLDNITNTTINTTGLATSGSIQTGNITTADITSNHITATGDLNVDGMIDATANIRTELQFAMKSNNNLAPDAILMKLGDELRINSGGTNSKTSIYNGTIKHLEIDSTGEVTTIGKITSPEIETPMLHVDGIQRIYNSTGKYSALEKINADLNIYASKNNPSAPSNINFFSSNGLSNDKKMTIHGSTNVVEVEELQANVNIKTDQLELKDTTSTNTSTILREQNTIKFLGDSLYSSCDFEFYTSDPAVRDPIPKLKINRTNNDVEVLKLRAPEGVITTFNTSITNVLSGGSLRFYNAPGKMFMMDHVGGDINFYGCKNNATTPSHFNFYTANGNVNDLKLKINAFTNVVEVKELSASTSIDTVNLNVTDTVDTVNLIANDTVDATTVVADQVSCVDGDFSNITTGDITVIDEIDFGPAKSKIWSDAEFRFQSGETLFGKDFKFATGNVPAEVVYFRANQGKGYIETGVIETDDVITKGNLYVENSTGKRLSIEHINDNIYFYGAKNNNTTPSNINFITNAGGSPSDIKLKINKNTNVVDVIDLNVSNQLIVNGTELQPLLTAGSGISIANNVISSTGGGSGLTSGTNININSNNQIETTANVEFENTTAKGIFTIKESTNVHDVMEYWNNSQSQFYKRSAHYDDYDMFDMMTFNNDATPANRSIDVDCDMDIVGDLVVNGTNIESELANKQPLLTAGSGITISGNTISTNAVTYSAGTNININSQDEIETTDTPDFFQIDAGSTSIGGVGNACTVHHTSLTAFASHALTQYSTGVTILNASAGQNLFFRIGQQNKAKLDSAGDFHIMRNSTLSNLPTELDQIQGDLVSKQTQLTAQENISLDSYGNISSPNPLSRMNYYQDNGATLTITNNTIDYYHNALTTDYNNLGITYTTQNSNSNTGWLLPQGVYKIECQVCFGNGTYNDRLGVRSQFLFNNVEYLPAQAYSYGRHNWWISKQQHSSSFIKTVPSGGEYMKIAHNCARNSSNWGGDSWNGNQTIFGMNLIINKLD